MTSVWPMPWKPLERVVMGCTLPSTVWANALETPPWPVRWPPSKTFFLRCEININESSLYKVSKLVATFTGFRIPVNKPVVGQNVFTQTAGIHADGDKKKNLYFNDLLPERFGRTREYALGKTSGKANIQKTYRDWGSPSMMTKSKK